MLSPASAFSALAYAARTLLLKWVNSDEFGPNLSLGLLWSIHAWVLAACYASTPLLLLESRRGKQWLAPLAAVGRMALTNYLLQASIIVPLCLGLNLFDRVTASLGLTTRLVQSENALANLLVVRMFNSPGGYRSGRSPRISSITYFGRSLF